MTQRRKTLGQRLRERDEQAHAAQMDVIPNIPSGRWDILHWRGFTGKRGPDYVGKREYKSDPDDAIFYRGKDQPAIKHHDDPVRKNKPAGYGTTVLGPDPCAKKKAGVWKSGSSQTEGQ